MSSSRRVRAAAESLIDLLCNFYGGEPAADAAAVANRSWWVRITAAKGITALQQMVWRRAALTQP